MNFDNTVKNPSDLKASEEFIEAKALISSGKGWKKWDKTITQAVYDRICEDARAAIEAFGLPESEWQYFKRDVIDYYIEHGTLMPGNKQFTWELVIFNLLRRDIDAAIRRRYRIMLAAHRRREKKQDSAPGRRGSAQPINSKNLSKSDEKPHRIHKNAIFHKNLLENRLNL